ncbi:helix-turn-helix domain-containing protein [Chengkuizengella axinellae]|uniref:Tetratricopeptide repeat protein n=1 Tax=Chengkuizengella axinellae TaxID=3064388 RepID=A0ABT9J2W2_9BACL|nr:tetratricopeptide repeat protein [Chengkuizengella sp. 2205SS18-9]MDP5275944.1 tetratricopeptide repeat protein [Chengkuizengella sp. 2205SS18-9]
MIGQRIKELRKQSKLTQQELAKDIITRSYLSQIEKGMVQPSYEVLEKLSKRLNCSVEDLYKTVENKDMLLSQMKREIKSAENYIITNSFDKIEQMIQKEDYFKKEGLNHYDKGILNWVHGKYYEKKRDFNHAITYYNESITELELGNHTNEMLRSLDSIGYVYSQSNQNEKALLVLTKAHRIMIYDQIHGVLRVSLLSNLGVVHGKLKEYYSAINFLEEARELNEKIESYYKAGDIYMALGVCYMELNRHEEAKKSYEKALKYFKLNENKFQEAGTYTNLGILSIYQDNYNQAKLYLNTAINTYNKIKAEGSLVMNAQVELGRVYYLQKEYDQGISLCKDIIAMDAVNKPKAQAYELLGDIYNRLLNSELSLEYYKKAKEIINFNHPEYKRVCKKIGDVYYLLNEYQKASDVYKECL